MQSAGWSFGDSRVVDRLADFCGPTTPAPSNVSIFEMVTMAGRVELVTVHRIFFGSAQSPSSLLLCLFDLCPFDSIFVQETAFRSDRLPKYVHTSGVYHDRLIKKNGQMT